MIEKKKKKSFAIYSPKSFAIKKVPKKVLLFKSLKYIKWLYIDRLRIVKYTTKVV